ncbi:RNA polymerase sigma factor SigI [uncultured Mycobacterium sp.]|uniref:RNA polymerase sigma factor SigI n=1 Tax=uncultured Mycobacterium sp. TaxID=171292 RepID=UPI0035CBFDAD
MSQPQSDQVTEAWRHHRPYLINLAYQMLGDVGEAEDVAQEAFLRLSRADPAQIDDVRGWLTVVASRICLDQLRSAHARYEQPAEIDQQASAVNQTRRLDPADRVTLDDEVRAALLEVLRRLSPGERVAFVLHDVFQIPFDAIAETVGRPVGTCRQLARRARAKFTQAGPKLTEVAPTEHVLVTEKFITACANGDLQALAEALDPTVWGAETLLADPAPPQQVNHGPDAVATSLLRYLGPGVTLVSGPAGQPVLLAFARRRLFAVLVLTLRDQRITKVEATVDPLARIAAFDGAG